MFAMKTPQALLLAFSLSLSSLCSAHPRPLGDAAHTHTEKGRLFGRWWHEEEHHAVKLFRRQASNSSAPTPGSPAFNAMYPGYETPDPTKMPQLWQQKLAEVTSAGLIPTIVQTNNGVYPSGTNGASKEICNAALECQAPGDIWDAPDGTIGISFDDGPTQFSPKLYDFLLSQNQQATHFFIGSNIKANTDAFAQAFKNGDEIAVHTWSHPFMTSLTNAQIVSELGWTMQIISDLTGGRVARYWRPPMGDSDNRVRAIAQHVFGLQQVDWNQDTADYTISQGKITLAGIEAELNKFISMPKSPGLIILEHELYNGTVQAFIDVFPQFKAKGWATKSIGQLFNSPSYQNAQDDSANSPVYQQNIIVNATGTVSGLTPSGTAASSAAGASNTQVAASSQSSTSASSASGSSTKSGGSMTRTGMSIGALILAVVLGSLFTFA